MSDDLTSPALTEVHQGRRVEKILERQQNVANRQRYRQGRNPDAYPERFDSREALQAAKDAENSLENLEPRGGRKRANRPELWATLYIHPEYEGMGTLQTTKPIPDSLQLDLKEALEKLKQWAEVSAIAADTEQHDYDRSPNEWKYPNTLEARKLMKQAQQIIREYPAGSPADAYALASVFLTGDESQLAYGKREGVANTKKYQLFKTMLLKGVNSSISNPVYTGRYMSVNFSLDDIKELEEGSIYPNLARWTAEKLGVTEQQAGQFQQILREDNLDRFRRQYAHLRLYGNLSAEEYNLSQLLLQQEKTGFYTAEEAYPVLKNIYEKYLLKVRAEQPLIQSLHHVRDDSHGGARVNDIVSHLAERLIEPAAPDARRESAILAQIYQHQIQEIKQESDGDDRGGAGGRRGSGKIRGSGRRGSVREVSVEDDVVIVDGQRYKNFSRYEVIPDQSKFDAEREHWRVISKVRDAQRGGGYNNHIPEARLVNSIGLQGYRETKRYLDLWNALSGSSVINSSYNPNEQTVFDLSSKLADAPLWVQKEAFHAGVNSERPGNPVDMFDAAKAWQITPLFWKNEAVRVGQMDLWKRMVAGNIIEKLAAKHGVRISREQDGQASFNYPTAMVAAAIQKRNPDAVIEYDPHQRNRLTWESRQEIAELPSRTVWDMQKDLRQEFWKEFQQVLSLGKEAAISQHVTDSKASRRRAIQELHMAPEVREELIAKHNVAALTELNVGAIRHAYEALRGETKTAPVGEHQPWMVDHAEGMVKVFQNSWRDWLKKTSPDWELNGAPEWITKSVDSDVKHWELENWLRSIVNNAPKWDISDAPAWLSIPETAFHQTGVQEWLWKLSRDPAQFNLEDLPGGVNVHQVQETNTPEQAREIIGKQEEFTRWVTNKVQRPPAWNFKNPTPPEWLVLPFQQYTPFTPHHFEPREHVYDLDGDLDKVQSLQAHQKSEEERLKIHHEQEAERWANHQEKMEPLSPDKFTKWLEKNMEKAPHWSRHDATYFLNKGTAEEMAGFGQWLHANYKYQSGKKVFYRDTAELGMIATNWSSLTSEERRLGYQELLTVCRAKKYEGQQSVEFAAEAASHGIPAAEYKEFEEVYLRGQGVPEPFGSEVVFEQGGLIGRFLPRSDPRVGFFGNYTGCCQHFKDQGKLCAISTIKDPFSQLFVVERNGRIIAGSWIWESEKDYAHPGNSETIAPYKVACFDNVEASGGLPQQQREGIREIYEQAGAWLAQEKGYRQVTIGTGNGDMSLAGLDDVELLPLPRSYYGGYSDAKRMQVLLAENENAHSLNHKPKQSVYVRGAFETDLEAAEKLTKLAYPDGWQHVGLPEESKNMTGMVLEHERDGVIGFVVWDAITREITDMVVHPEHRRHSTTLINALMEKAREEGQENWFSAELRDSTTYRLVKAYAERGKLEIEELGQSESMNGEARYHVKFRPAQREVVVDQSHEVQSSPTGRNIEPTNEVALALTPARAQRQERT